MNQKLTQAELDERIQILKRFRSLLEQQRKKFQEYLKVLEAQESKISEEDAEALLAFPCLIGTESALAFENLKSFFGFRLYSRSLLQFSQSSGLTGTAITAQEVLFMSIRWK